MTCKAQRINDEMQCGLCGLTWAVDDPQPPPCPGEKVARRRKQVRVRVQRARDKAKAENPDATRRDYLATEKEHAILASILEDLRR